MNAPPEKRRRSDQRHRGFMCAPDVTVAPFELPASHARAILRTGQEMARAGHPNDRFPRRKKHEDTKPMVLVFVLGSS
jgi:hypothetical protein